MRPLFCQAVGGTISVPVILLEAIRCLYIMALGLRHSDGQKFQFKVHINLGAHFEFVNKPGSSVYHLGFQYTTCHHR